MSIQETFAHNLRAFRKLAGLTQEELAESCGFHRTYIGGIEQQKINVSLKNINKIATALGVHPAQLFAEVPEDCTDDAIPGYDDVVRNDLILLREEDYPDDPLIISFKEGSGSITSALDTINNKNGHFKLGDYALCTWTDDGVKIETIDVKNEDISMRILCTLASQGCDDLAAEYEKVVERIEDFLNGS